MSERPRTLCPTCRQAIEAHETDVVEAVELVKLPATMGAPPETAERYRAPFHPECFPVGSPRWRRV